MATWPSFLHDDVTLYINSRNPAEVAQLRPPEEMAGRPDLNPQHDAIKFARERCILYESQSKLHRINGMPIDNFAAPLEKKRKTNATEISTNCSSEVPTSGGGIHTII
jgi:hypothetical protein